MSPVYFFDFFPIIIVFTNAKFQVFWNLVNSCSLELSYLFYFLDKILNVLRILKLNI